MHSTMNCCNSKRLRHKSDGSIKTLKDFINIVHFFDPRKITGREQSNVKFSLDPCTASLLAAQSWHLLTFVQIYKFHLLTYLFLSFSDLYIIQQIVSQKFRNYDSSAINWRSAAEGTQLLAVNWLCTQWVHSSCAVIAFYLMQCS